MVVPEEIISFMGASPRGRSHRNFIAMHSLPILGIIQSDLGNSRLEFGVELGPKQVI